MNNFKLSKKKEIELFVLCIWLFLIRIAIPFAKYFFVPFFILCLAYTILRIWRIHAIVNFSRYYLRVFSSFLLVCMFFIIGILFSSRFDFFFLKEGLAMLVLVCIGMMAFTFIESEDDFRLFTWIFMRQLLAFCIFICIFSLMKLFFLLRSVQFEFLSDLYGTYPKGTSLVLDYNFYSMICILGIVTCAFVLIKERSKMHSVLLQLLVFGLILDVMFSTSRRGIVALSFILLILFLILLFGRLAGKGKWMSILSEKLRLVFLFLFSFIFLLIFFLSQNPFKSTNTMHSKSGFEQSAGSNIIHVCVRRYFTILNPGTDAYFGGIIKDPDNRFSGGRVQRIKYGIKIFSQDYSTSKKIIGGGFDYLWDFGKEFYSKNNHRFYFDYPHNPILSALLYSGIAGGLSLVYFFFMTFLNFYRSFRSLFYYICLYVIIFSFAFFSGNSIFGCPEFVLISLFPFYFTIIKYKGHREARSAIA